MTACGGTEVTPTKNLDDICKALSEEFNCAVVRLTSVISGIARPDYHNYIGRSESWKARAKRCKKDSAYRCQLCNVGGNGAVLHAHHRTYANLGMERPEDLICLCADCHKTFHEHRQVSHGG